MCLRKRMTYALTGLVATTTWAHTTLLPHHAQDFEDLVTGKEKRGIVLLVTLGFLGGLVTLGTFVYRQSKQTPSREDTLTAQRRIKEALIQVAASARPRLGQSEADVRTIVSQTYARAVHASFPETPSSNTFSVGGDHITLRYKPPTLEVVAHSETGGAWIRLSEQGDFTIGTFPWQPCE